MNPEQFFDALALVPNMRAARFNDLEVTEASNGRLRFRGHAAVFDEEAEIDDITGIGKVTESVKRGAFRKVLQLGANVPLTIEHDPAQVLATTRSGTLRLQEDTKGLDVDADVPPTQRARDLKQLVDDDVVSGMSFGFVAGKGNFQVERRSSGLHRTLTNFKKLIDVTTTWDPTYLSAEAQFRSIAARFADSPESLQQLFQGAYPQLGSSRADDTDDTNDDEPASADEEPVPDEENERLAREGETSGVVEHRSIAARRRALSFLVLTTGGIDHDET